MHGDRLQHTLALLLSNVLTARHNCKALRYTCAGGCFACLLFDRREVDFPFAQARDPLRAEPAANSLHTSV